MLQVHFANNCINKKVIFSTHIKSLKKNQGNKFVDEIYCHSVELKISSWMDLHKHVSNGESCNWRTIKNKHVLVCK